MTALNWALLQQQGTLDGIPLGALDVNAVGVVGVVVLIGIGFATGRLYTRSQVNEITRAHEREIDRMEKAHERELADIGHDRDEWRTSHRISETGRLEERDHNAEFVRDVAAPLKAFLEGFRQTAKAKGGTSE